MDRAIPAVDAGGPAGGRVFSRGDGACALAGAHVVEVNSHLAPERAALAGDGATDERALMLTIVDNAGVTRVRSVPARRAKHVARVGAGLAPSYVVFAVDDQITSTPGFDTPSGNMRLVPDLASGVALSQPS